MNLEYVNERITEIESALLKVAELPDKHPIQANQIFNYYRGQLFVWREVQRSLSKVSA